MAHPGIKSDEGGGHACCHVRFEVRKRIKGHGASQKLAFIFDFFVGHQSCLALSDVWSELLFAASPELARSGLAATLQICRRQISFVTMADCNTEQDNVMFSNHAQ